MNLFGELFSIFSMNFWYFVDGYTRDSGIDRCILKYSPLFTNFVAFERNGLFFGLIFQVTLNFNAIAIGARNNGVF